ncbi:MAG: serine hydrolase [Candidatus Eremiobacteraeota bacterium]|nr:serine hydrolase [Candidatus Eremiobacteraeota bacterium]
MSVSALELDIAAALAYAERNTLHALAIAQGDDVLFESYAGGYDAERPHALYSGTKSFWGVLACAAQEDGTLHLDESVAETIGEWRQEPRKCRMTIRDLLQLTSGFGFGGLGSAVPTGEAALATPLRHDPGTTFTYGGIPLQVFGEVVRRKLGREPHAYLRERVLDPLGMTLGSWRTLKDGTHPLPTGAFVATREWLKFGALVASGGTYKGKRIAAEASIAECLRGSRVNANYGLGFWLRPIDEPEIVHASGSGGQALYVVPSRQIVVAHFGASRSWRHATFLRLLFGRTGRTQRSPRDG